MKGNQNYLELAGVFLHYSKCEKEIQKKLTLVQVSTRFKVSEGLSYRESTASFAEILFQFYHL